jgi:hypothetical protein
MRFIPAIFAAALLAVASTAQAALVFQYNATLDNGVSPWTPNVNNSSFTRDFTLGGATYVANAGSSYPGITAAFDFSGAAGSGGTTASFGANNLPLGGTTSNNAGASATFELWVKPDLTSWDDLASTQVLFETGGGVNGLELILLPATGGAELRFYTSNSSVDTIASVLLSNDYQLNDFVQIVGVVDPVGGSEEMRLYVNGAQVASNTNHQKWQAGPNGAGLGRVNGGHAQEGAGQLNFDGQVALVNIYDNSLSDTAVQQSFVAVSAVPEPASLLVLSGLGVCFAGFAARRNKLRVA